jgi:hypothetical protein
MTHSYTDKELELKQLYNQKKLIIFNQFNPNDGHQTNVLDFAALSAVTPCCVFVTAQSYLFPREAFTN